MLWWLPVAHDGSQWFMMAPGGPRGQGHLWAVFGRSWYPGDKGGADPRWWDEVAGSSGVEAQQRAGTS